MTNSDKSIFFGANLLPEEDCTYYLGSPMLEWNEIYGTLRGNAETADFAKSADVANNADVAKSVSYSVGTVDEDCDVWFSDGGSNEMLAHGEDFKYNPSTNTLTVGTVVGNVIGTASGNLTPSSTLDATKLSGTIPSSCYTASNANISKIWTGTCSTAAATTYKYVILDDATGYPSAIAAGTRIAVTFTVANTASRPMLTIQDSDGNTLTGSTAVAYRNANGGVSTGSGNSVLYGKWGAYETVFFTYNGSYWTYIPAAVSASAISYRGNISSTTTTGTSAIPLLAKTTGLNSQYAYSNSNVYIKQGTATGNTTNVSLYAPSVTLSADPTSDMQAATKQYVDNAASNADTVDNYHIVCSTNDPPSDGTYTNTIYIQYTS